MNVARWTQTQTKTNLGMDEAAFIAKAVRRGKVDDAGMKQRDAEDRRAEMSEGEG